MNVSPWIHDGTFIGPARIVRDNWQYFQEGLVLDWHTVLDKREHAWRCRQETWSVIETELAESLKLQNTYNRICLPIICLTIGTAHVWPGDFSRASTTDVAGYSGNWPVIAVDNLHFIDVKCNVSWIGRAKMIINTKTIIVIISARAQWRETHFIHSNSSVPTRSATHLKKYSDL